MAQIESRRVSLVDWTLDQMRKLDSLERSLERKSEKKKKNIKRGNEETLERWDWITLLGEKKKTRDTEKNFFL